ncbi:MAG TPA: hypothetical protein PKH43_14430, partial [Saprospiraceae bacterium]|nr:hypothetical protein [Saprospiraceae bacterium]
MFKKTCFTAPYPPPWHSPDSDTGNPLAFCIFSTLSQTTIQTMLCRLRLFCWGALSLLLLVFSGSLTAQTFSGQKVPYASLSLQKKFTSWEVFSIDAAPVHEAAKSAMTNPSPITLNLDGHHWTMYLSPSRVTASNYKVQA